MSSVDLKRPAPLPHIGDNLAPDGRVFPWGPIDAIHCVGPYAIVEYREDRSTFTPASSWQNHGRTLFAPYLDGRSVSESFLSLDSALVGAVAYRREGPNSQAAHYFDRMTGVQR